MRVGADKLANLESEIIKQVRAAPGVSRVSLAKVLQLAPSTVGHYVARLRQERFLTETKHPPSEAGRPPTQLHLNPEGGQFIGIDFEAHNIMGMAVDFSDTPLKHVHRTIETKDTVPQILKKIEEAIVEVLPESPDRLLAIGIGVPGLVDSENGVALQYKHIKQWNNVGLTAVLSKEFG